MTPASRELADLARAWRAARGIRARAVRRRSSARTAYHRALNDFACDRITTKELLIEWGAHALAVLAVDDAEEALGAVEQRIDQVALNAGGATLHPENETEAAA